MSKRGGERTRNPKVKKRRGVKIHTTIIPDSDEEDLPSNVDVDYARLVQTRITASGKIGNITMSSIPLLEGEEITGDSSLEAGTNCAEDPVVEDVVTVVSTTQRKQKKVNDSVSIVKFILLSSLANDPSDEDAILA